MIKSYSELIRIQDYEERYEYLRLRGRVGEPTFGFERYLNQKFYTSMEWRNVRRQVTVRDGGLDMAHPEHQISGRILIHHINPLTERDIRESSDALLDPNNLISVSHKTHNAIHYGDKSLLPKPLVERAPGDTTLWRRHDP